MWKGIKGRKKKGKKREGRRRLRIRVRRREVCISRASNLKNPMMFPFR